jgi:hypothetical protein
LQGVGQAVVLLVVVGTAVVEQVVIVSFPHNL